VYYAKFALAIEQDAADAPPSILQRSAAKETRFFTPSIKRSARAGPRTSRAAEGQRRRDLVCARRQSSEPGERLEDATARGAGRGSGCCRPSPYLT